MQGRPAPMIALNVATLLLNLALFSFVSTACARFSKSGLSDMARL
jgi:hypothetical protein